MTQKQNIVIILAIILFGGIFIFVYRQFTAPMDDQSTQMNIQSNAGALERLRSLKKTPEPETINEISESIQDEISADLSALDDEADGEIANIEAESESVTNVGTVYDENSL